jgi:nitrate reductase gamma subunit
MPTLTRGNVRAFSYAVLVTAVLVALIVIGSRQLSHFDAALVAYTFATLFAAFGLTYRYAIWLQRPPTAVYWKRGWQVFLKRGHRGRNAGTWARLLTTEFAANSFIFKRSKLRWLAHMGIMWGCVIAAAITFPLVFGWMSFESLPDNIGVYRVIIFGFPTVTMPHDSFPAFMVFHGLVWAAFLTMGGVMLAMRRRMRDPGAAAAQIFSEDFLPLILLFSVSLTGLLLTVSYTWLKGSGYEFLAIVHAVTVIFTLLWLPFGKFFHIFQRPAQLGVEFYKDVAARSEAAYCGRCGHGFASRMHIDDLKRVENLLGFRFEVNGIDGVSHYQEICPRCRRVMLSLAQGKLRRGAHLHASSAPLVMPQYVNSALNEGPLGSEDRDNFHP